MFKVACDLDILLADGEELHIWLSSKEWPRDQTVVAMHNPNFRKWLDQERWEYPEDFAADCARWAAAAGWTMRFKLVDKWGRTRRYTCIGFTERVDTSLRARI